MRQIKIVEVVPFSAAQLYTLINDVEAYPSYIPWCPKTKVISQSPTEMTAKLYAKKGPVSQSFTTRNTLVQDKSITLALVDGPFKSLEGRWLLKALSEESCEVDFEIKFELINSIMDVVAGPILEQMTGSLVEFFKDRAQTLHGVRS